MEMALYKFLYYIIWLVHGTSKFLIRKNKENIENLLQIVIELLLLRRNSCPGPKFKWIVANHQKKHKNNSLHR